MFYLTSAQIILNQFLLIDVSLIVTNIFLGRFPYVFFRFPLFILLPCKLLHLCLRNELLIKTFIIIIVIIIYSD